MDFFLFLVSGSDVRQSFIEKKKMTNMLPFQIVVPIPPKVEVSLETTLSWLRQLKGVMEI